MRSSLRFLIVWLLALALPMQAFASATMLHCGPSHERMQAPHTGAGMQAAHDHGPGASPRHHDDEATSVAGSHEQALPAGDGAAQPGKRADLGKYKCSACASCCSMGALLSPVLAVPAASVAPTEFFALVPSVDAFAADGPDRPPRIILA